MCVWCPLWPVQRRLSEQPALRARPLILFAEGRRGLAVSACSPEAMRFGISVGMPLGEARSLLPTTASRRSRQPIPKPVFERADPEADRTRLQALAIHCQRYSPLVGLEDNPAPESLWLDISGSEVLFGGEAGLAETLQHDLAQQGIQVRIAVADTWGAAWAVSRYADPVVSLVPSDEQANVLAPLPVAALRVSDAVIDSLRGLDVTTVGRLMKLPRASLPSRFGKELGRRIDQATGLAPELLTAERLIEPIVTDWLFEEPVTDRQTLDHVCEVLLERLLVTLETRRAGLRELTCRWLGTTAEPISLRLLRPTTERRHLLDLLRLQCERTVFVPREPGFTAGVKGVRMEVVELGLPPIRQATLFEDDVGEKHQRALAELVDRLSSRLGRDAVLRSSLQPDPLPEFSCATLPWLEQRSSATETVTIPSRLRCRPLRLLRLPQPLSIDRFTPEGWPTHVDRSAVVRVSGPERIESGWWRGVDAKRDYYRLTLATGAALWAFCDLKSGRWFLHGLFD